MTTKITLDPQLVRKVLGKYIDASKSIMLYASYGEELWEENKDAIVQHSLNIHEFKDLAIKWCAGKGYYIERKYNGFMGAKGMFDVGIALYQGNGCDEIRGFDYDPKTTSISEAELAAISFCYKQIQENKNNGN